MKNISLAFLFFVGIGVQTFAQTVSEATAKQVATNYFNQVTNTGKVHLKAVDMNNSTNPAFRSAQPAFYVFVPQDKPGFVIVSATESTFPILAISDKSAFSTDDLPPAVESILNGYRAQIEEIRANNLVADPEIKQAWSMLTSDQSASMTQTVLPEYYLKTQWDQGSLYNKFCPLGNNGTRALTGCVATALAQVLKFWNYPVTGKGGYVAYEDNDSGNGVSGIFGAPIGDYAYNWKDMPNKLDDSTTEIQNNSVANLIYHCGVAVKMNYGVNGSSAYTNDYAYALDKYFGFLPGVKLDKKDNYSEKDWAIKLRTWLDAEGPILYDGGAHAWVCDGYFGEYLFHMNWGWGGQADGYFLLNSLNPSNKNYTNGQQAVHNLRVQGCLPFYKSNTALVLPASVEVGNYIQYWGTVYPSATVNFSAFNSITLTPGATITQGSTFRAWIEGCNGSFTDDSAADRSDIPADETTITETSNLNIFPNPFNGTTTIAFSLPLDQFADLKIFNMDGKVVAQLVQPGTIQHAGAHQVTFDGSSLSNGVYFVSFVTGDYKETKRVVLVK